MTEIRWKNGGPLFLQPAPGNPIGLVAADQDCCCPPPPPERCWCPDACSYFIEVVEPSVLAVRHGPYDCEHPDTFSSEKTVDSLITDLLAFAVTGQDSFQPRLNKSISESSNNGALIAASVTHGVRGYQGDIPDAGNQFGAGAYAAVTVFCQTNFTTSDVKYYARVILYAASRFFFDSLGLTTTGYWFRQYYEDFELPASCIVSPARSCSPFTQQAIHLATPLTITLSGDGTCSLGNLTMITDYGEVGVPPDFPYAKDAVDDILGGISCTFRITSRPSCETVDCSCSAGLDGVVMSLFGESFTIGNEPDPIRGVTQQRWEFEDGTSPRITYEVFDELFLETQVRVVADLFCSSTEQNSNIPLGGIPTWHVIVYSDCFTWDGGVVVEQTRDTWIGAYNCYEHCGSFLPSGAPYPFILVSKETTPGLGSCDPPPLPEVILSLGGCE